MKQDELDIIIQKIKDFELINNAVDQAFIDITILKVTTKKVICNVTIYDDDFSSKSIFTDVVYPQSTLKKYEEIASSRKI